jgi:hypothetical protein
MKEKFCKMSHVRKISPSVHCDRTRGELINRVLVFHGGGRGVTADDLVGYGGG